MTVPVDEEKAVLNEIREILRNFSVLQKTLTLYPRNHPTVESTLKRTFRKITSFLKNRGELRFGVTENEIILHGSGDEEEQRISHDLAVKLHQFGVLTLRITPGLTREEYESLWRRLLGSSGNFQSKETVQQGFPATQFPHIHPSFVDYRKLMQQQTATSSSRNPGDFWIHLIRNVRKGDRSSIRKMAETIRNPEGLLTLQEKILRDQNVKGADHSVSHHAKLFAEIQEKVYDTLPKSDQTSFSKNIASMACSEAPMDQESREMIRQTFLHFPAGMLLKVLASAIVLRGKLDSRIASTFKGIAQDPEKRRTLLDNLDPDSLERQGEKTSPFIWGEVRKLILAGSEEPFMSDDYHQLLEDLNRYHLSELKETFEPEILEKIRSTMDRDFLRNRRTQIILGLIPMSDSLDLPSSLSREVQAMLEENARRGNLREILSVLKLSLSEDRPPESKEKILKTLFPSGNDSWVSTLLDKIGKMNKEDFTILREILFRKKEGLPERLLVQLGKEQGLAGRKRLATLLVQLGEEALPALLKTLEDDRWYLVRNAVMILGRTGNSSCVTPLMPLLNHPRFQVVRETIHTLSRIGGDRVVPVLKRLLFNRDKRTDPDLRKTAAYALKRIGTPKAREALQEGLTVRNRKIQRICADTIRVSA